MSGGGRRMQPTNKAARDALATSRAAFARPVDGESADSNRSAATDYHAALDTEAYLFKLGSGTIRRPRCFAVVG